jgi:uncharacterized protein (TIGR02246 family)
MVAREPEDVHAALEAAFNSGDIDAYIALYEEDATLVTPPDGGVVRGRSEIRRASAPLFAVNPKLKSEVVGRVRGDELALTHARWVLEGTDPDNNRVELGGRGTIVSRRQPDGTWLIVLDNPMSPA